MVLVLGSVTVTVVGIRLLYKQLFSVKRQLDAEDWMILLAVPIGIASVAITIFGLTAHGLGKDIWGLHPSNVVDFELYSYIMQILYIALMALVKLNTSVFYLNIFSGTIVRRYIWGTIVYHITFLIIFVAGTIFQCTPIGYQWADFGFMESSRPEGNCININAASCANAALNVASDFWLLAIPLTQIKGLRLHWKKKVGVALMFMTGAM